MKTVVKIEVLEDFSGTARCDEGFLQVRRLRCQNQYNNGGVSKQYQVDVINRPRLDAVAALVYRRQRQSPATVEVLTRLTLRPAAYFRQEMQTIVPDNASHLFVEEVVAGLLESADVGELGICQRAAKEVWEEAGIQVDASLVERLGAPFFAAPGILSEKIFPCAVDVTGLSQTEPEGDGSPLEEGSSLRWTPIGMVLQRCVAGEIVDAKTELLVRRFLDRYLKDVTGNAS